MIEKLVLIFSSLALLFLTAFIWRVKTRRSSHRTEPLGHVAVKIEPDMLDSETPQQTASALHQPTLSVEPIDTDQSTNDIPTEIFRSYDIRGDAALLLTPNFAELLGKAFASLALEEGETAIHLCRDGRLSSPELHQNFSAGVLSTGCDLIDLGINPTPLLNFAVATSNRCGTGVMITASHSPGLQNGFKFLLNQKMLQGKSIESLRSRMVAGNFREGAGVSHAVDFRTTYLRHITEDIVLNRPFSVIIDGANGVAGALAAQVLRTLGCRVDELFCEIDGRFPNHDPDCCKAENLQWLIERVRERRADVGFAFDGDGDRIIAVTDRGDILWPDQMMMLIATQILTQHPAATLVYDVKCSRILGQWIAGLGGRGVMTRSGRTYVNEAIHEQAALFGGEFSGHLFFTDRWYGIDDGIYAACRILECLVLQNRSLSQLYDNLPKAFSTQEINLPMAETLKSSVIEHVHALAQGSAGRVNSTDGIRVEFESGWGLLRASNTGALLSLRFEAESESSLEEIKSLFRNWLHTAAPDLKLNF